MHLATWEESHCKILVLEDDPHMREALGLALSDAGYQVILAQRGEEAISRAAVETFDLVVSDIKMPGLDGLQTVERLKKQQPTLKSIIVTGYSNRHNTLRAVELGVSDFFRKPFQLDDFLSRVKEVLAQHVHELKQLRELQILERACLTSLRACSQLLDPDLDRVGEAARTSAHLLSQEERALRQTAELVTLLAGIQHFQPTLELPQFGSAVQELLECSFEKWDGSGPAGLSGEEIPLISRVVGLSLARHLHPPAEFRTEAHDPVLLEREGASLTRRTEGDGDENSVQGLLSLAQTMELANDLETAHQSYLDIVNQTAHFRQKLEAQVGLARVAELSGLREDCLSWVARAQKLAHEQGPDVSGRTDLALGLLLLAHEPQRALQTLQRAEKSLNDIGDNLGRAQAVLAQRTLSQPWDKDTEAALEHLFKVEHRDVLRESGSWLLLALAKAGHSAFPRVLREHPSSLHRMVERFPVSETVCNFLLDHLEESENGSDFLSALRVLEHSRKSQRIQKLLTRLSTQKRELPVLRIQTFGPFEVYFGEQRLAATRWKRKKIRYLLAYLTRHWKRAIPEDLVLEEFWPGPLDRAKRSLYQATWELRKSLKLEEWPRLDYVQRRDGQLSLNSDLPIWRDLEGFERAIQEGNSKRAQGDQSGACRHYSEALAIARGPFLEDCYQDWAVETRENVQLKTLEAREFLAQDCYREGRFEQCLQHAGQLVSLDPFWSPGHLLGLRSLSQLGRRAELVKWFESYSRELQKEMDLQPAPELVELYREVKAAD